MTDNTFIAQSKRPLWLYERIREHESLLDPRISDGKRVDTTPEAFCIGGVVPVVLDAVSDCLDANGGRLPESAPSPMGRLPWRHVWAEWRESTGAQEWAGCEILEIVGEDAMLGAYKALLLGSIPDEMQSNARKRGITERGIEEAFESYVDDGAVAFAVCSVYWSSTLNDIERASGIERSQDGSRRYSWSQMPTFWWTRKDGSYYSPWMHSPPSRDGILGRAAIETKGRLAVWFAFTSLLQVHNITTVDMDLPRAQRRRLERDGKGSPFLKYKTLKITLPGKTRRSSEDSEHEPHDIPFHLVRGHLADYREGKGLFGNPNLRRVIWVPAHHRGDPEVGAVAKKYETAVR